MFYFHPYYLGRIPILTIIFFGRSMDWPQQKSHGKIISLAPSKWCVASCFPEALRTCRRILNESDGGFKPFRRKTGTESVKLSTEIFGVLSLSVHLEDEAIFRSWMVLGFLRIQRTGFSSSNRVAGSPRGRQLWSQHPSGTSRPMLAPEPCERCAANGEFLVLVTRQWSDEKIQVDLSRCRAIYVYVDIDRYCLYFICFLMIDRWFVISDIWHIIEWYMIYDWWYIICDICFLISDLWYMMMVWYMISDIWWCDLWYDLFNLIRDMILNDVIWSDPIWYETIWSNLIWSDLIWYIYIDMMIHTHWTYIHTQYLHIFKGNSYIQKLDTKLYSCRVEWDTAAWQSMAGR